MTDDGSPTPRRLSRRGLLVAGASATAVAAAAAGVRAGTGSGDGAQVLPRLTLPPEPEGLPGAQHEWEGRLPTDADDNAVAPRHQRLLLFALAAPPSLGGGDLIEAALRLVETHADGRREPLSMVIGWGPSWFDAIGQPSPVPVATAMSTTEAPTIDDAAACLHLACDDEGLLEAVDQALTEGTGLGGRGQRQLDLRPVLRLIERRAGFVGSGMPRAATARLQSAGGVDVPAASPLFMGFKSGMRKNQASEAAVTIDHGRWRGGTTMHVSRIALTLPSWYDSLDDEQRTARMHGPGVKFADAAAPGAGLTPPTSDVAQTARRYGVIGHTQAAAGARQRDKPVILRRDFNGVQDGQPVVHFVALQRSIDDFVATRRAMNADAAVSANPAVGTQVNNGINEWISVHNRANFLVPPRALRAFPGLRRPDAGATA